MPTHTKGNTTTKSPQIDVTWRHIVYAALLRAAGIFGVMSLVLGVMLVYKLDEALNRVDAVTVLAGQNQAKLQALGQDPVGPNPKSVAEGKTNPQPTEVAPTSPAPTYREQAKPLPPIINLPTPTLSAKQKNQIVQQVLGAIKIPKPTPGKPATPASSVIAQAVVSVLRDNPSLTLSQITSVVSEYLKAHPPKDGKPGTNGSNGVNGNNGNNGTSVTGSHVCQTDDTSDYCTYTRADGVSHPVVGDLVFQYTDYAGNIVYQDVGRVTGEKGDTGDVGAQGPGPTDQQIQDAVNDWMDAHPQPMCDEGYHAEDKGIPTTTPVPTTDPSGQPTTSSSPTTYPARICVPN